MTTQQQIDQAAKNWEKTREERYKEEWYNLIRKWNEEFNYYTKPRVYRNTIRKETDVYGTRVHVAGDTHQASGVRRQGSRVTH